MRLNQIEIARVNFSLFYKQPNFQSLIKLE